MLWAQKNTLNEGHIFAVQEVFVDGMVFVDVYVGLIQCFITTAGNYIFMNAMIVLA